MTPWQRTPALSWRRSVPSGRVGVQGRHFPLVGSAGVQQHRLPPSFLPCLGSAHGHHLTHTNHFTMLYTHHITSFTSPPFTRKAASPSLKLTHTLTSPRHEHRHSLKVLVHLTRHNRFARSGVPALSSRTFPHHCSQQTDYVWLTVADSLTVCLTS